MKLTSCRLVPYIPCPSGRFDSRSSPLRLIPHVLCVAPLLCQWNLLIYFLLTVRIKSLLRPWGKWRKMVSKFAVRHREQTSLICSTALFHLCEVIPELSDTLFLLLPETQPPSVLLPSQMRYLLLLKVIKLWATAPPLFPPLHIREIVEAEAPCPPT